MGFAGYVTVCVQLYCASCHCLTLHVSAYMAIFRCVGYFYFHTPEGICFADFFVFFFVTIVTNTHARNKKINEEKQHRKNANGNVQSVTT
jgi:hypothetical protein